MPNDKQYNRLKAMKIIEANKDVPFVDRIVNRSKYPVLDLGDGRIATHKMSWVSADDGYYVFPLVQYRNNEIKEYDTDEAFNKAIENNDFIKFKSPKEADWFSKNYKVLWDDDAE